MNEYAIIAKRMAATIRKMQRAFDLGNTRLRDLNEARLYGMETILDIMGVNFEYVTNEEDDDYRISNYRITSVNVMGYDVEV